MGEEAVLSLMVLRLRLLGYGRGTGLSVGLIVAAAALGTPAPHISLGVIPPGSPILVARVIGAGAVSLALALAIPLALALPTAPALTALAPALAAHLRQTGHRPEHDQSQCQSYTDR